MLAGDSFVFEEHQILGNQKLLPHPKTDASILLNISQLPSNGKFQTKQKVTNLAPENRPTPTFSGAVAVKLQGVGATGGPRLYYWYHWYLHLTMLRKNTWAPAKSESFNWILLLMFFFVGGIRLLMLLEHVCGFCVWWNLVLGFVDVIFGRSLYSLFGSIPHKRVN